MSWHLASCFCSDLLSQALATTCLPHHRRIPSSQVFPLEGDQCSSCAVCFLDQPQTGPGPTKGLLGLFFPHSFPLRAASLDRGSLRESLESCKVSVPPDMSYLYSSSAVQSHQELNLSLPPRSQISAPPAASHLRCPQAGFPLLAFSCLPSGGFPRHVSWIHLIRSTETKVISGSLKRPNSSNFGSRLLKRQSCCNKGVPNVILLVNQASGRVLLVAIAVAERLSAKRRVATAIRASVEAMPFGP